MENIYQSATSTRANFSSVMDKAVYDRPQFIQRTRSQAVLMGVECANELLRDVKLHCTVKNEDDGSYVLVCKEIEQLIATGATMQQAKSDMAAQLIDYAKDYYNEFGLYSRSANTKKHLAYVMKAILLETAAKVEGMIECQAGKN